MSRRPAPLDRVRGPVPSPELRASVLQAAARARWLAASGETPPVVRSKWLASAWYLLAAMLLAGHLTLDALDLRDASTTLASPRSAARPEFVR